MKRLRCLPVLLLFPILVAAGISLQPVWADVYAYFSSDGSVNLSNEPVDGRYSVLVQEPSEHSALPSAAANGEQSVVFANKVRYDEIVDEVANEYGLESALLHAVITVESRYRPKAVSRKGAAGLMQIMPDIAKRYGVADPLDPVQNLHGGAKYLRDLMKKFHNNRSLALAAYNAGEGAVAKYGNQIPPYPETASYVPRVLGFYRKYRAGELEQEAGSKADVVKG
jgi:hypothetical protein